MWYPIAGPSPIAVHGPISGPKDLYRAVDRYRARPYRSKRLELRFAVVVHSPIVVHGPITVQPEFFKLPRRNVPLGICPSTDFSAFSSFRRETCGSTSLSALIFVPFQEQTKVWRGLPGIFVRCVVLFFFLVFCSITCVVFSKGEERRFGEGLLGLKKVTLTKRQTCFLMVNLLLSGLGVWAGKARNQCVLEPLVNSQPDCCQGFGRAKPAISVATLPPPPAPSLVELTPSARQWALRFRSDWHVQCVLEPLVNSQPDCCQGFGRAKPVISVATPPPPPAPSLVGLTPSARQWALRFGID